MNPLPPPFTIPGTPEAVTLHAMLGPIGAWLLIMPIVSLVAVLLSLWLEDREAHACIASGSTPSGGAELFASAVQSELVKLEACLTERPRPARAGDRGQSDAA